MARVVPRVAFAVFACAGWAACSADPLEAGGADANSSAKDDGGDCGTGLDCKSGVCTGGKCTGATTPPPPKGDDGKKNGDESDVDCGGTTTGAPRCGTDKGCNVSEDCESKVCSPANKCAAPTATDKVQNGDETDVDCGGKSTNAPKCEAGKSCIAHDDCASDGCDDQKKCAIERSCTQTNGGRTCGTGEVGDPNAKHESCCLSLPIPGSTVRLDKYKVTAGRMRTFVERVKGDVQGWYDANKGNLSAKAVGQIDAWKSTLPKDLNGDGSSGPVGANYQLGGFILLTDMPSTSQGCYTGNASEPANGSHTYFTGTLEGEDRPFDQAFLDRLPLNCVPYPILAAFCAWDGGRLQTYEENSAAYGPGFYPWGNTPEAGGFADYNGAYQQVGPARYVAGQSYKPCPGCDLEHMNWSNTYQFPEGGDPAKPWDYAYFISAPGRFPLDKGPGGHMDLGGIMMELTASPGAKVPGPPGKYNEAIRWSRAGSWEGHEANYDQWSFPRLTKYGKTGGRCARD